MMFPFVVGAEPARRARRRYRQQYAEQQDRQSARFLAEALNLAVGAPLTALTMT
jgi:hypothetical protein